MPSKKSALKPLRLSTNLIWGSLVQQKGENIILAGKRTKTSSILGVYHPVAERMYIRTMCLDGSISRIVVSIPAGIRTNGPSRVNVYKGD